MPLPKDNGFSLVELLIAMLLLTFGLLSAITLETSIIQGNTVASRMDEATGLAQERLEQLRIEQNPATLVNGSDVIGVYSRVWTITAGPTAATRRVQVEVTWATGPGNRQVRLADLATGGIE